jgi:hypothetical protein
LSEVKNRLAVEAAAHDDEVHKLRTQIDTLLIERNDAESRCGQASSARDEFLPELEKAKLQILEVQKEYEGSYHALKLELVKQREANEELKTMLAGTDRERSHSERVHRKKRGARS